MRSKDTSNLNFSSLTKTSSHKFIPFILGWSINSIDLSSSTFFGFYEMCRKNKNLKKHMAQILEKQFTVDKDGNDMRWLSQWINIDEICYEINISFEVLSSHVVVFYIQCLTTTQYYEIIEQQPKNVIMLSYVF
jgi:hypothetical protein